MKNKISIITDEISQDLGQCKTFLDNNNLSVVELRMIGDLRVPDITKADIHTLKQWVDNREISVNAISPGLFKCDMGDRNETERYLQDILPRSIEMAKLLDARYIITFSFNNPMNLLIDSFTVGAFRTAATACAEAGLELLVENEPGFLAETATDVLELVKTVDHPAFKVNWDPANSNQFETQTLSDGLKELFPYIRNVHVKNACKVPGQLFPKCCSLTDGEIDWRAHLALLKELDYTGYLGIETHYTPYMENSLVVLKELRDILAEIGY